MYLKRIEAIALGVLFVISPALTSAQSAAELEREIKQLLSKVDVLKSQLMLIQQGLDKPWGTSTKATSTPRAETIKRIAKSVCPRFIGNLNRGSKSDSVKELQTFLAEHFDVDPSEVATGYFGNVTEAYLKRFQGEQGLESVGSVGPKTKERIMKLCEKRGENLQHRLDSKKEFELRKAELQKKLEERKAQLQAEWEESVKAKQNTSTQETDTSADTQNQAEEENSGDSASAEQIQNLANALTALEVTLEAIIAELK